MAAGEIGHTGEPAVPRVASVYVDVTAPVTPRGRPRTGITVSVTALIKTHAWISNTKV